MKTLALITIFFVGLFIGFDVFAGCGLQPVAPLSCSYAQAVCACGERGGCAWMWLGCS